MNNSKNSEISQDTASGSNDLEPVPDQVEYDVQE